MIRVIIDAPPTAFNATDSLRALSIAEEEGWAKKPGLPHGLPNHCLCMLVRGWINANELLNSITGDPSPRGHWGELAILCGPTEDLEYCHLVLVEEVPDDADDPNREVEIPSYKRMN